MPFSVPTTKAEIYQYVARDGSTPHWSEPSSRLNRISIPWPSLAQAQSAQCNWSH